MFLLFKILQNEVASYNTLVKESLNAQRSYKSLSDCRYLTALKSRYQNSTEILSIKVFKLDTPCIYLTRCIVAEYV